MAEQDAKNQETKSKPTRSRSPNYPALNLADAVERTKEVWEEVGTRRVGDEDVARALGYNKLHGKSRSVVSALKKYGLMRPDGDGYKVSEEALDIINLDSDDPDRAKAMRNAALKPTLFAELHQEYGDKPPGDSLVRNYLNKKNFNSKIADDVIRLYRDTMDLVSHKIEEYTADEPEDGPGDDRQERDMERHNTGGGESSSGAGTLAFDVPGPVARQQHYGLSEDRDVYLLFVGEPTKEDIETLKAYLGIFQKRLPSEGSLGGNAATENGHPTE